MASDEVGGVIGSISELTLKINEMLKKPVIDTSLQQTLDSLMVKLSINDHYLANGIVNIEFAEAALLIESSSHLYSKKVDLLWDSMLEYQMHLCAYNKSEKENVEETEKITQRINRNKRKKVIHAVVENSVLSKKLYDDLEKSKKLLDKLTSATQNDTLKNFWKEFNKSRRSNTPSDDGGSPTHHRSLCINDRTSTTPLSDYYFSLNQNVNLSNGEKLGNYNDLLLNRLVPYLGSFGSTVAPEGIISSNNQDWILQKYLKHVGVTFKKFWLDKLGNNFHLFKKRLQDIDALLPDEARAVGFTNISVINLTPFPEQLMKNFTEHDEALVRTLIHDLLVKQRQSNPCKIKRYSDRMSEGGDSAFHDCESRPDSRPDTGVYMSQKSTGDSGIFDSGILDRCTSSLNENHLGLDDLDNCNDTLTENINQHEDEVDVFDNPDSGVNNLEVDNMNVENESCLPSVVPQGCLDNIESAEMHEEAAPVDGVSNLEANNNVEIESGLLAVVPQGCLDNIESAEMHEEAAPVDVASNLEANSNVEIESGLLAVVPQGSLDNIESIEMLEVGALVDVTSSGVDDLEANMNVVNSSDLLFTSQICLNNNESTEIHEVGKPAHSDTMAVDSASSSVNNLNVPNESTFTLCRKNCDPVHITVLSVIKPLPNKPELRPTKTLKRKSVRDNSDQDDEREIKRKRAPRFKWLKTTTTSLKKFEHFFLKNYITDDGEADENRVIQFEEDSEDEAFADIDTSEFYDDGDVQDGHVGQEQLGVSTTENPVEQMTDAEIEQTTNCDSIQECNSTSRNLSDDPIEEASVTNNDAAIASFSTCNETTINRICEKQTSSRLKAVSEWRSFIEPKLRELDRNEFDIHEYGTRIMNAIPDDKSICFGKLASGKQSSEVCRLFLASLQLANTGNIDIMSTEQGKLANDKLEFKLLSKERYHEHLEEYEAPSEHSFFERLAKAKAACPNQTFHSTPKLKSSRCSRKRLKLS